MTTHEVQSTRTHCTSVQGSMYHGASLSWIHMARKATEKKCQKSTSGLRIRPASRPMGPSTMPSCK